MQIQAYHAGTSERGLIGFDFIGDLTEAQKAALPKYVGWSGKGGKRITLKSDKVNEGVNETGIKKIKAILKVLNGDYEYKAWASNAHATMEEACAVHDI